MYSIAHYNTELSQSQPNFYQQMLKQNGKASFNR